MLRCAACGRNMPPQCLYCAVCGSRMPHALAAGGVVAGRIQVERALTTRGRHMVTFLAKDKQNGQPMVLKELRDDLRATPQHRQEFQDEVRAVTALQVPGVPPVRGVIQHEGRSYMAMAFIPGHTLRSMLARQPRLTIDQALTLLRTLATILQALHEQFPPLVHLDITPDNILLGGWDKAVLLDGSWLRRLGNPHAHALAFDEAYAAPETLHGQPVPASDLYALGVTIVESLTGIPAARMFNPNANRLTWDPVPHPLLQEVLLRLTEGPLTSRFGSASQVLQALNEGVLPPAGAASPFGQPAYGQAAPSPYGQPAAAYGQAAPNPYGTPAQPGYGQPGQPAGYPPQGMPGQPAAGYPGQQPGYPVQGQMPPGYPQPGMPGPPGMMPGQPGMPPQQPAMAQAPVEAAPPPAPPPPPAQQPTYAAPKLTAAAAEALGVKPAPAPPPPPPPPPEPPPPAPPPTPREPPKIVENIDDVSTEEGLDALMALYEAQNS